MRRFTLEELARLNCRDGGPTYFAYQGKVYDASNNFQWQQGRHQVTHPAGIDHTRGLDSAPHGADLLERCPIIGILVDDS